MKPQKDVGYTIRCTGKETGDVKFLFVSTGTETLGKMIPNCFGTQAEAQAALDCYDQSRMPSVDMHVVKVTVIVEDP